MFRFLGHQSRTNWGLQKSSVSKPPSFAVALGQLPPGFRLSLAADDWRLGPCHTVYSNQRPSPTVRPSFLRSPSMNCDSRLPSTSSWRSSAPPTENTLSACPNCQTESVVTAASLCIGCTFALIYTLFLCYAAGGTASSSQNAG